MSFPRRRESRLDSRSESGMTMSRISNFARLAKREFRALPVAGLFIAIGHKPDTDIFKGQIELDEKGYIITSQVEALRKVASPRHPGGSAATDRILNKKDSITSFQNDKDTAKVGIRNFDYNYPYMTSVPGIFASGDCVDHTYRQAGTAVGMGIAAALEIEKWLESNNKS